LSWLLIRVLRAVQVVVHVCIELTVSAARHKRDDCICRVPIKVVFKVIEVVKRTEQVLIGQRSA
jgi:hypothetical protein